MGKWTRTVPTSKAVAGIIRATGNHEQRLQTDQVIGAIHSLEVGDGFVDATFRKGPIDSAKNEYGINMLTTSYKPNEILPQTDTGNWTVIRFEGLGADHIKSRFTELNTAITNQPKQREP